MLSTFCLLWHHFVAIRRSFLFFLSLTGSASLSKMQIIHDLCCEIVIAVGSLKALRVALGCRKRSI